jgi:hypothetical protein
MCAPRARPGCAAHRWPAPAPVLHRRDETASSG